MRSPIFFQALLAAILGGWLLGCDSTDGAEDGAEARVVRIISPTAGQVLKVDDTVRIIVESDYSKFGGGVSVDYSPDSSKTWYLIESFNRKDGVARDTLKWFARETGDVAAGSSILLKAYDYEDDFSMTTGILFSN